MSILGLGRGIGFGISSRIDPDVQSFISAQGITNAQEKAALNTCVIQLKGNNSLSKNYWSDIKFLNLISPTSLAVSKQAIKYITTQGATAIGTDATHSSDGVAFNGTNQGWDLNNELSSIPQVDLLVLIARSNTITANGISIGANDAAGANTSIFYPRPVSVSTSGFLSGTLHGALGGPGVYVGSNDGTYLTIHKDGIKITPSAETARLTGTPTTKDVFYSCRNNNATAGAFVDEIGTTILISDMNGTPYTTSEIAVLSVIIQTYNTNVA